MSAEHVVVDSVAFIRNAPIKDLAENAYTVKEAVSEIRDAATRQRLQVLPYDLKFREPTAESLQIVTDFSKKTGDYRSLSAVDIKLMALTYQLTKEHIGTDHIRLEPKKITWSSSRKPLEKSTDIAGFFFPTQSTKVEVPKQSSQGDSSEQKVSTQEETENIVFEKLYDNLAKQNISPDDRDHMSETDNMRDAKGEEIYSEIIEDSNQENESENVINRDENNPETIEGQGEEDDENNSEIGEDGSGEKDAENGTGSEGSNNEEEDDGIGWITPRNIGDIRQSMGDMTAIQPQHKIQVGCLTADFAMQNVLIQMGLNVISVDGMLIRRAKSFVLKCHACFKVTSKMGVRFCPMCGNQTLDKVSVSVDADGTQHYHMSKKKAFSTRGLKYSLPLPRGGKHASNPVLCADQPLPQNRIPHKAMQGTDVFDPNYVAHLSPFSLNDVTSRASHLGINGRQGGGGGFAARRNPNENKSRKGKRK